MKKTAKARLLILVLLASLFLAGCSGLDLNVELQELYSLPTLPAQYTELNNRISQIMENGAEYAAPTSGTNIQPVQLVDLNGDGREEAVAFFRKAADEKPLKIYIFSVRDDRYEQTALIEGSGTGIYSIVYRDLDGNGTLELAVGWKAAAELQVLEVYTLREGHTEQLLRTNYVKYTAADLDGDGRQELVILRSDEEGNGVADYYIWQEGGRLVNQSSARISATMAELSRQGSVTAGVLRGGAAAVFVTGVTDTPQVITDILASRGGTLNNIVLSGSTGVSTQIHPYCALDPTDINGDGVTEVPCPVYLPGALGGESSYQQIEWRSYDEQGVSAVELRTYHDTEDGWYLRLPEEWNGIVTVTRTTQPDDVRVTFYALGDGRAKPFLRISTLTGATREVKAVQGDRFLLARQSETIYTGELMEGNQTWQYGLTADDVRAAFNVILPEWAPGDN
ncbi:MAG: VCBS repeat-containing protein [Ruminococcaceae bacterium]|nr:VCBS repeat-containing protein [Oscillospiraceae bacterium]